MRENVTKNDKGIKYILVTDLKANKSEWLYKMLSEYDRVILMTASGPVMLSLPEYK